eukprot:CAMPEP_0185596038 /NCGR_PEP_ID=MMETSP0434-20130131/80369_1 /TAXON_ID=626734 ORGANISM="Favella taraikaensis, Strain Fe Narragansett Bay" /NCGR_SAMPLE_ID=MMETSP0434 /ASSEMBLY_ACC=CAM_ASM_000379 /LENGTH=41 /DNA_ID= /DNA_START= /DNA_END= /DNA_ORIENTATION=
MTWVQEAYEGRIIGAHTSLEEELADFDRSLNAVTALEIEVE